VPVGTIGRRASYSESPPSFHNKASRPTLQVAMEVLLRFPSRHAGEDVTARPDEQQPFLPPMVVEPERPDLLVSTSVASLGKR
jgi:hypothetical protein